VENDQPKGIYFVGTETTSGKLLKTAGIGEFLYPDFKLNDGMKITINSVSGKKDIVVTKIALPKGWPWVCRLILIKPQKMIYF